MLSKNVYESEEVKIYRFSELYITKNSFNIQILFSNCLFKIIIILFKNGY